MQATFPVFYPERPIMSNIIHCHLWLSPRLRFPAIAIWTNPLILFSIIVVCSKIIRGASIGGFLLLNVKCTRTKIHSTPGIYIGMSLNTICITCVTF
ncbi:unnamed protein product [Tenebrio molitor]|nr:unnamed protein product [Tenebrio molitor]